MRYLFTLCIALFSILSFSQEVTHGPIIGGVTDTSCRVFIRTSEATSFGVEFSTQSNFSSGVLSFAGATNAAKDTIAIVAVTGLTPDTRYYVRTVINSNLSGAVASFETFPAASSATHQVFVAGSCIYDLEDSGATLFNRAATYHPKAFIQMGDWGYPDASTGATDIYLSNPPTSFAVTYANHQHFYKLRYQSPSHIGLVQSTVTDYVYDDHDYLNDNSADDATSGFGLDFLGDLGAPKVYTQPAQARLNTIRAYLEWFPGYKVVDSTEGVYHSFRSGNVEVFVLDLRSMRTPQAAAIKKVGSNWVYQPPAGYSLIGANQMAWLKNGLANSTATWKVIISSDAFNVGLRYTTDSCLKIGGGSVPYWAPDVQGITLPNKGYTAVQNYADCWAGFHEDADSLLTFVIGNNIKNVFMVSGDSHTVGLDDGTNSGLPEVNAGNLKKANSLEWLINQQFMNFNVWNKGGTGLCNLPTNDGNTFSKVEVWGNDSLRLSAEDAQGNEVCGWTFMANEAYKYNPQHYVNRIPKGVNDAVTVPVGGTATIPVLNNDSDVENDPMFVNLNAGPANGTATVNGNNTFTYTPNNGFTGVDTFNYAVCDHTNPSCTQCSYARVTVTVGTNAIIEAAPLRIIVYPNPAKNEVYVLASEAVPMQVQIQNIMGQTLLEQNIGASESFDVSALAGGNYIVSVKNLRSNEIFNTKLTLLK
jgi:phosphodiesterase/alkaline phosphatase D-like protein